MAAGEGRPVFPHGRQKGIPELSENHGLRLHGLIDDPEKAKQLFPDALLEHAPLKIS